MSAKDYMKYNQSTGTVVVDINRYQGNAFVDAIKVRDIANVQIVKRDKKEKKQGGPDVMVIKASGETTYITRQELIRNYKYLSGKRIVIPYMKNNVKYTVIGACNQPYAVMLLPSNMVGIYNGKRLDPGTYIVAPKLPDGGIDYNNLRPVSRNLFKKMFKIPNQDVIARHSGKTGSVSNRVRYRKSNRMKFPGGDVNVGLNGGNMGTTGVVGGGLGANTNHNPMSGSMSNIGQPQNRVPQQVINEAPKKNYPFRAVAVIVTQDTNTEVGYLLEDTQGRKRQITKIQAIEMCRKEMIANLTAVTHQNGKDFIRGRGVSVESLPRMFP